MANLNDANMAVLDAQGRQRGATSATAAEDPRAAAIIREAQANVQREKERRWMEQDEILPMFGTRTAEDPIFLTLHTVGFKSMGVMVIPGSRWKGTQDKGELVFDRHDFDLWRSRFDTVAQRMGYVKKR